MTEPAWYSQRFRPDGGITAEGLRNQLGRPTLSVLTVLVRESAQNSWDAKLDGDVDYKLDLVTVSPAHRQAWNELLAPNAPEDVSAGRTLTEFFRGSSLRYLAVSDRGTTGLAGPVRSDEYARPNERGWLSFVLNSGERQDVDGGGGTYGYGKGAFFLASRTGAVLIYTRFDDKGALRSRLIGSALLSSGDVDGVPYTGRHWWGRPSEDFCEPLVDEAADSTARRLGLPEFRKGETGTTVVVLDPDLTDPAVPEEERAEMPVDRAGEFLAEAAAWNLWPLMLEGRTQRLRVSITAHGASITVPSEHDDAVLANFAEAYRKAGAEIRPNVVCRSPKKEIGRFGYVDTFGARTDSVAAAELGLSGSPHHVCCMRSPDLVVQYLEQQPKAHPDIGYAGVFKVDDELDQIFSKAEPPTHDAWIDAQLVGREATFVRVAARRLKEECAKIVGPKVRDVRVASIPVGSIAERLGFLVSGIGGTGGASNLPAVGPRGLTGDVVEGDNDQQGSSNTFQVPGQPQPWDRPDAPDLPFPPSGGVEHGPPASTSGPGAFGSDEGKPDVGGTEPVRDPGTSTRRPRRPLLAGTPYFRTRGDRVFLAQKVQVWRGTTVRGVVTVITGEGSAEVAGPAGGAMPQVVGWLRNGVLVAGDTFAAAEESVEVDMLVSAVEDAAVDIAAEVVL